INKVFGIADKANTVSSRLIFRDAYMIKDEVFVRLESGEFTDMPFTEMKVENTIDRVKGKAKDGGIRNIERIPAGAKFNIEIILNIIDDEWSQIKSESDIEIIKSKKKDEISALLQEGLNLLNNDYLGGSGSRGYGHVKIDMPGDEKTTWKEELIKL
ncbi:MAG: type III-A CRISPR-associated RAMP protein Csm3, partial [Bacteroidetes bacterium]|nr:type III-A CRISPR-associated RAMP protein Csm3 [Bacteroidota bacterium]